MFDHAALSPANEVYTPGSTVTFSAVGADKSGGPAPLPDGTYWSVASGYGTIDSGTGRFTSNGTEGDVTVCLNSGAEVVGQTTITIADPVLLYLTQLCEATRSLDLVELGVSPRGIIALSRMARACAIVRDRDYVTPEDVQEVFVDVCAHRLILKPQARIESMTAEALLHEVMESVAPPALGTHARR